MYRFEEFELDGEGLELRCRGKLVKADALVLRLLTCLVSHAGQLVTKDQLVEEVWQGRAIADNAITVSMARLRKVLGHRRESREFVTTTYGRGYRFVPEVSVASAPRERGLEVARSFELPPAPPLVGREPTLQQLREAWGRAGAQHGRCVLLLGEPGIGKTYVVEAFARELRDAGARVAWGFCREAGDTPPLWPWLRLLREVVGDRGLPALESSLGSPATRDLEALLDAPGTPTPSMPGGTAADWHGPKRTRIFEGFARALRMSTADEPWLLIIDDLHRADGASLELLHHLLDGIADSRLLVIATLRHGRGRRPQRPGTQLASVLSHPNAEHAALTRLRPDEVASYIQSTLSDPSAALVRAVYEQSEGNPFFMTELMRTLRDGEREAPESLALPHAALDPIGQRLARLAPEVRSVLSIAAVLGRSFELPVLAHVSGRDEHQLMLALDDALDEELIVAAPDSSTAFAFGHELLRAVFYDGLPPQERRAHHARVVKVLEQRRLNAESIPDSELAYHAHAALPEGDLRTTVRACRAAAATAAAVFANHDVVRYTRHAIEALDLMDSPSLRLRMNLWFMIAVFARGYATRESTRALREVARLARDQGDGGTLVRLAAMYNLHPGLPPLPGAAPLLADALRMLPAEDGSFRAVATAALATASPNGFSSQRCLPLLEAAVAGARKHGTPGALYAVLIQRLYLLGGPDHEPTARETAEQLSELAQRHPELAPVLPIDLALQRALRGLQDSEREAAQAEMEGAADCARRVHHAELLWHCERSLALTLVERGAWREGLARLEPLHRQAELQSLSGSRVFLAFDRCVTQRELGCAPEPDESLRSALQYEPSDPPIVWALKLRALANCGFRNEAQSTLRMVLPSELPELPCDRDLLGTLGHVARAALSLGAGDYLDALVPLLTRHAQRISIGISFWSEGSIEQLLGMIAHARGRTAEAMAHLEAGLRANERAGLALRALEARTLLARWLIERGGQNGQRKARALVNEAKSQAQALGLDGAFTEAAKLAGG